MVFPSGPVRVGRDWVQLVHTGLTKAKPIKNQYRDCVRGNLAGKPGIALSRLIKTLNTKYIFTRVLAGEFHPGAALVRLEVVWDFFQRPVTRSNWDIRFGVVGFCSPCSGLRLAFQKK